mgnify:CR=1 FL=1
MPNICPYCELEFKSKHQLQGHYRICSAVSNNTMPLMHDGITIRKLYDMVQILTKQQEKMKLKIRRLESSNRRIKKKISIMEYINENYKEKPYDFSNWQGKITIQNSELKDVITNGFASGVSKVLIRENMNHISTLKAFNEKDQTLYVYNNERWTIMTDEMFKSLCLIMIPKLLMKFASVEKNIFADKAGTRETEKYSKARYKIYGEGKIDKHIKAVKKIIYKNLRMPIRNITKEYI